MPGGALPFFHILIIKGENPNKDWTESGHSRNSPSKAVGFKNESGKISLVSSGFKLEEKALSIRALGVKAGPNKASCINNFLNCGSMFHSSRYHSAGS
jgi:hypothetical protein